MSAPGGELGQVLRGLADALEAAGVTYAVGGSVASSMVGEPRATVDVDVAVVLDAGGLRRLVAALGDAWYVPAAAAAAALVQDGPVDSFNVVHLASMLKADLFVLGDDVLDAAQIARRERIGRLWVTSPADQVLRKLWWYRLGGGTSEQQWRDVVSILRVQGDALDLDDVYDLARAVGLDELLDRARSEADLS